MKSSISFTANCFSFRLVNCSTTINSFPSRLDQFRFCSLNSYIKSANSSGVSEESVLFSSRRSVFKSSTTDSSCVANTKYRSPLSRAPRSSSKPNSSFRRSLDMLIYNFSQDSSLQTATLAERCTYSSNRRSGLPNSCFYISCKDGCIGLANHRHLATAHYHLNHRHPNHRTVQKSHASILARMGRSSYILQSQWPHQPEAGAAALVLQSVRTDRYSVLALFKTKL